MPLAVPAGSRGSCRAHDLGASTVETMQRSDTSSLSATSGRAQPVPDSLAEFRSERPAPIEPATARPAPPPLDTRLAPPPPDTRLAPPPPDTRLARPATVASAVPAIGSDKREKLWSFAFGLVCGALLCLIVVYPLMTSEPGPAPASQTLLEQPPAAEPSIVVSDKHRDRPVPDPPVVNTSRPPTTEAARPTPTPETARPTPAPKLPGRDVPRAAVPVPREEGTSARFVGALQIDSTPRGARVFIDRQPVGVTPLVLTGLVVGSRVVRLEADGHAPWSSAVRVIADRQTDVRTTLAPSLEDESPRP
jgi:PEGA domain